MNIKIVKAFKILRVIIIHFLAGFGLSIFLDRYCFGEEVVDWRAAFFWGIIVNILIVAEAFYKDYIKSERIGEKSN